MKATVKKIDLGRKKKQGPSGFYSVFLFIVVAGAIVYFLWDQPLALQLRDAIHGLIRPMRDLIDAMLRTE